MLQKSGILHALLIACASVTLAAVSFAAIEAGLLMRQSRKDEIALTQQVSKVLSETSATETDARRTIEIASGAVNDIRHIAMVERDQSQKQAILFDQSIEKLNALLDTTNTAIQDQDTHLSSIENQTSADLANVEKELSLLKPVIESTATQVPIIAQNLGDTSEQVKQTSQSINVTAQNMAASSADIRAYIHRITAPVRGTWNFIKSLLGPAANARTLVTGP